MLAKSNAEVADDLRSHPGEWFLVAADEDPDRAHTYSQTAYRIRLNYYDGKGLADFAGDDEGEFDASASSEPETLPDGRVAACTLRAAWLPKSPVAAGA